MNQELYIRVSANLESGIGHLMRTLRIARKVSSLGVTIGFFVDKKEPVIESLISPFEIHSLYDDSDFNSEINDAEKVQNFLGKKNYPCFLIVDDYRLSYDWESYLKSFNHTILSIDDIERRHCSHFLLDSKWEGSKTLTRYEDSELTTKKFLGPGYILIDDSFKNIAKKNSVNQEKFVVFISFGGGGDGRFLVEILRTFLKFTWSLSMTFKVVIGPYMTNKNDIMNYSKIHKNIHMIYGSKNLYNELKTVNLFLGASGTTLFEALALGLPTVSFSISDNQVNSIENLQDLGNFIHIGNIYSISLDKFALLVEKLSLNIDRLISLFMNHTYYKIDSFGTDRVSDIICAFLQGKDVSESCIPSVVNKPDDIEYKYEHIDDSYLNTYLNSRNLEKNQRNMINAENISLIDHYLWWFTENSRSSFVLRKGAANKIFIWHEIKKVKAEISRVLIGGWFIGDISTSPLEANIALEHQLSYCDKEYPGIPWVAVIHKDNKSTQAINKRHNFKLAIDGTKFHKIARLVFRDFSDKDFLVFYRNI